MDSSSSVGNPSRWDPRSHTKSVTHSSLVMSPNILTGFKNHSTDDDKEITAIKARAIVWKNPEAEKNLSDKATQLNRDNGFEEKGPFSKNNKTTKSARKQLRNTRSTTEGVTTCQL